MKVYSKEETPKIDFFTMSLAMKYVISSKRSKIKMQNMKGPLMKMR